MAHLRALSAEAESESNLRTGTLLLGRFRPWRTVLPLGSPRTELPRNSCVKLTFIWGMSDTEREGRIESWLATRTRGETF